MEELLEVARQLQVNASAEADASAKYVEQLKAIDRALMVVEDAETRELLEQIKSATNEKISDELNHNASLIEEFVALTGIKIAED